MEELQEMLKDGDIQAMNTLVSQASDDVYITAQGRVYIHPCASDEIVITSLGEASDYLGYDIALLVFTPASETGRKIITYWLDENHLTWDSPSN